MTVTVGGKPIEEFLAKRDPQQEISDVEHNEAMRKHRRSRVPRADFYRQPSWRGAKHARLEKQSW